MKKVSLILAGIIVGLTTFTSCETEEEKDCYCEKENGDFYSLDCDDDGKEIKGPRFDIVGDIRHPGSGGSYQYPSTYVECYSE